MFPDTIGSRISKKKKKVADGSLSTKKKNEERRRTIFQRKESKKKKEGRGRKEIIGERWIPLGRDTGKSEMMRDISGLTIANDSILFVEGLLVNHCS